MARVKHVYQTLVFWKSSAMRQRRARRARRWRVRVNGQGRDRRKGRMGAHITAHRFVSMRIIITFIVIAPCDTTVAASIYTMRNDDLPQQAIVVYGRKLRKVGICEVSRDMPFLWPRVGTHCHPSWICLFYEPRMVVNRSVLMRDGRRTWPRTWSAINETISRPSCSAFSFSVIGENLMALTY